MKLNVLEVSHTVAGGYCGKLLADAGAVVTRIDHENRGSAFDHHLHTGKRSVGPQPIDGYTVATHAAGQNVLIEDTGLDVTPVRSAHPDLLVVSISPFGRTGPWSRLPADEFTLQAWCGSTASRGSPDRGPVCAGGRLGEYAAAGYAAVAALTASAGDHLDVSMLEAMLLTQNTYGHLFHQLGAPDREGPVRSMELPSVEPAKDGFVGFCTITAQQFQNFLVMIERPDLLGDDELATAAGRRRRRAEFLEAVHAWTTPRTVAEILELADALRVPAAPVVGPDALPEIEHFRERGVLVPHPEGFLRPRTPYRLTRGPVPRGESPTARTGRPRFVDLRGVRVVDLTAFWAGPSATHLLAALGAEVIKVESAGRPDPMRFTTVRPEADDWWEYGPIFHGANTGKRGITLDLTRPEGHDLLQRLIENSDVLIENFTPRVLDQLGLTPDRLHARNPRLVVVRMPAFGLDGPWRDKPGFAQTMEQVSGLAWITGEPDLPPMLPKAGDPIAGVHAALATLVALDERATTGTGLLVEAPMIEAVLNVAAEAIVEASATGTVRTRTGNRDVRAVPRGVYACAGEEQWIAISVDADEQWRDLAAVLGWTPRVGRDDDHDLIDEELSALLRDRARDETVALLLARGIRAAPVLTPSEASTNPQLEHRRFLERLVHPVAGPLDLPGPPFRSAQRAGRPWLTRPAPTLGQHNTEILTGLLGLTPGDVAELRARGVIGETPWGRE
ncbi:CoA transferase [Actinomadura kijaniata]|uniref:Crotonobetainyl-CoA:carnitine CoA-transferase CaiB-like acyl-CoA transferase n=1 Tax=Actinomadura namibiensis TaxID=182080 RepID=A0A7W3QS10_ACTNM|nr:CoA transferase [Actinomadura namibiensis]MBA8957344.1 crotonobetainyl-CoA:carnitine CoA-transferase CaiB-like acyl-CoA transferase [Actinomadura namibiensis]